MMQTVSLSLFCESKNLTLTITLKHQGHRGLGEGDTHISTCLQSLRSRHHHSQCQTKSPAPVSSFFSLDLTPGHLPRPSSNPPFPMESFRIALALGRCSCCCSLEQPCLLVECLPSVEYSASQSKCSVNAIA